MQSVSLRSAVVGFTHEEDARRVMAVLPKRFERFGLQLHPEKTRLVEFKAQPTKSRKPDREDDNQDQRPARKFELLRAAPRRSPLRCATGQPVGWRSRSARHLGFTHIWGHTRKGKPIVKRSTASSRFTRGLKELRDWMRHHRHDPVREQWRKLMSKMRGHAAYYGITGNSRGIGGFSHQAQNEWFKWLNRRGGKKPLSWEKFSQWLRGGVFNWPAPRIRSQTRNA